MKITKIEDLIDGGSYFIKYFMGLQYPSPIMSIGIVKYHDETSAVIATQKFDNKTRSFECVELSISNYDIMNEYVEIIPLVDKNVFSSNEMYILIKCMRKLINKMCSDYFGEYNKEGGGS